MAGFEISFLAGFSLLLLASTYLLYRKKSVDLDEFLVAGRDVGHWRGALTILATWTAPPAILLSSQIAYQQGLPGAFWFTVPNALGLIVFGLAAKRIKNKLPQGFTVSEVFGNADTKLYALVTSLTFLVVFIILMQSIVGGAAFLTQFSGLNEIHAIMLLLGVVLSYSLISGLDASIFTDIIQMAVLSILIFIFVPWTISNGNGLNALIGTLTVNNVTNIFTPPSLYFGIVMSFMLLTIPFVAIQYWQRVYAIKENQVRKAHFTAGTLFFFIPATLSILGFMAAASGTITVNNPLLAGYNVMNTVLPFAGSVIFILLLTALLSSADSALVGCSSLITKDLYGELLNREVDEKKIARISMVGMSALVSLLAILPFSFLDWMLFNGPIGAILISPIIASLFAERSLNPDKLFYSITAGAVVSFPLFTYATLQGDNILKIAALASGLLITTIPTYLMVRNR